MLTRAGDITLRLPDGWADVSEYVYVDPGETASVRISRTAATPEATPAGILADRLQTLSALGRVEIASREDLVIDGRPAACASLMIEPEESATQKDPARARILAVKVDEHQAICIALIETVPNEFAGRETWEALLKELRFSI